MALTVQNIVDDVAADIRNVLTNSGSDLTLITRWVDRIHKDVLHTSVYRHETARVTTITSSAGTVSYSLTPTDVRRIEMVYDRAQNRVLRPMDAAMAPTPEGMPNAGVPNPPDPMQLLQTTTVFPIYYRLLTTVSAGVNAHTIYLFPAPATSSQAGTVEVHYHNEAPELSGASDKLTTPPDARDCIVAGVNWLASTYLKRNEEAQQWFQVYQQAKRGEI